jgi:hypothetical protein
LDIVGLGEVRDLGVGGVVAVGAKVVDGGVSWEYLCALAAQEAAAGIGLACCMAVSDWRVQTGVLES